MFFTIEQIEQANHDHGHHWFDPDSRRFFKSRASGPVIAGRYFVSSERQSMAYPRLYTIREVNENGAIGTVGEFQEYASKRTALNAARALS